MINVPAKTDNVHATTDNVQSSNVPENGERIRKIKPIFINVDRRTWNLFKKISDRSGVTLSSMATEAVLEWVQKNRDLVNPEEKRSAEQIRKDKMQVLRDIQTKKRLMALSSPCRWYRTYPNKPWPGFPS